MTPYEKAIVLLQMEQVIVLDKLCAIVATASLLPKDDVAARALIKELREACQNSVQSTLREVRELL